MGGSSIGSMSDGGDGGIRATLVVISMLCACRREELWLRSSGGSIGTRRCGIGIVGWCGCGIRCSSNIGGSLG